MQELSGTPDAIDVGVYQRYTPAKLAAQAGRHVAYFSPQPESQIGVLILKPEISNLIYWANESGCKSDTFLGSFCHPN